jgi:hypothetical protein
VTGAFEGWFKNPDGTFSLLLGYFNRNTKQELDIPIGPNNRIDGGGPDQGQPTHFLTGRQWGMFTVRVPADFGKNKLVWTLVANGQELVIPASLHPDYEISPFSESAVGNSPPVVRFAENGPAGQGPLGFTAERTAKVGVPLTLTAWVQDDAKLTTSSGAPPRNLGLPVNAALEQVSRSRNCYVRECPSASREDCRRHSKHSFFRQSHNHRHFQRARGLRPAVDVE